MRTAYGAFGEGDTQPPPFPQPPLPGNERTDTIPTTADVGMVNIGQNPPPARGADPGLYQGPNVDPFTGEYAGPPIPKPGSSLPAWALPVAIGAAAGLAYLVMRGNR